MSNDIVTDPNTGEVEVINVNELDIQLYALNLAEDGRVLSVTLDKYGAEGQPRVTEFPDDDVSNYRYVDDEFIYDPLPDPPEPEPTETTDDVLNALLGIETADGGEAANE